MNASRWLTLAALTIFAAGSAAAAAQDIPLGDLARKNRKDSSKTKKVITNEDIPESPNASASAPAAGATGSGAPGAAAATSSEQPPQNAGQAAQPVGAPDGEAAQEDPVDAEIQQIQGELDALKQEAGIGVRSIAKLEEQLKDPNLSEMRRRTYEDILASGIDKVGSLESQIVQKEQALQQAQDKKKAKEAAARAASASAPK